MTRWKDDPKAYYKEHRLKNLEKCRAYGREWWTKNKEREAVARRLRVFGITHEEYQELLQRQDNKCAVCGRSFSEMKSKCFGVDHNHTTGKVRGILCVKCNGTRIATLDDVELLQAAIAYLRKTDPQHPLFQVSEV